MALEKESLINFLPDGFETLNQEGYKENFSADKIATGYEKDIKDRVTGPNLNNLIDVIGKNTNTLNNYIDYLNNMPISSIPYVNANNQLDYQDIGQLNNKADKNLANTGMITNCLLEVPQRIKYDLTDGTLTIKAGSVVIVPYGTEDLTSQYPVGATFLNDNFKVYDTQYEDGKFFVWAELVGDIVTSTAGNWISKTNRFICVNIKFPTYVSGFELGESGTGSTASTTYTMFYSTDLNRMGVASDTTTVDFDTETPSLPILLADTIQGTGFTSVNQVFNGMGYIGSTVWVDKGVKYLIANYRNEDGSLKNIEQTTDNLLLRSVAVNGEVFLGLNNSSISTGYYYLDEDDNIVRAPNDNNTPRQLCIFAKIFVDYNSGTFNITSFNPKQPFRAADYNDIDGIWVNSNIQLLSNYSVSSSETKSLDLSNSLPNDNEKYEILITCTGQTSTTSGTNLNAYISTNLIPNYICLFRVTTRTSSYMLSGGNCSTVIGADRTLKIILSGSGKIEDLIIVAYRKVR